MGDAAILFFLACVVMSVVVLTVRVWNARLASPARHEWRLEERVTSTGAVVVDVTDGVDELPVYAEDDDGSRFSAVASDDREFEMKLELLRSAGRERLLSIRGR